MGVEQNSRLYEYIDSICSRIKNKEIHEDIRLEIESHLLELYEEYSKDGLTEDAAIDKALVSMGDAELLGRELNKVHKQKPEWSILALTFIFSCAGLVSLYFIEAKGVLFNNPSNLFTKSLFFNIAGIAIACLLYFYDYRKIKPYSKHIYIGTLAVMFITLLKGNAVHGVRFLDLGPFSINIVSLSPFIIIFALSGILDGWNFNDRNKALYALLMYALPAMLILCYPSLSSAVIFSAAFLMLLTVSGVKLRYILLLLSSGLAAFLLFIASGPVYRLQRFLIFINPWRDPSGSGYLYTQINKVLNSAEILGRGFTLTPRTLPEVHTDLIFTYIVYTFGWAAGIALILMFTTFILRLAKVAKTVKNNYGKLLASGLCTIFAMHFLWNILMTLGLAPLSGVSLPFISYGGSQFIANMASVGIISGIYRRRTIGKTAVN